MPKNMTLKLLVTLLLAACGPAAAPPAPAPSTPAAAAPSTPAEWVSSSAIYEVFVRDFSPSGDFRGVVAGLDRIQGAGANVVWLMPIHPVGEVNRKGSLGSSYSVRDYTAVNPAYGTLADFRALVDAVHERGMRIIIDWVPNHTAWDNAWLAEHPDWYTRNATGEITEPLNDDGSSTEWTDVADLNYDNDAMRRAMIDAMRFWLEEMDVDGFRVDVSEMVPDDFWLDALPQLRTAGAELLLAEGADPKLYGFGFDLTYGWEAYHGLKQVWRDEESAADFVRRAVTDASAVPFGTRLRFTTNHDETAWDEPPVLLFGGPTGARAAFAAIALLPGVPLLYNGQEVESPQQLGLFEREAVDWDQPDADEARAWYREIVELARTHPDFDGGELAAVATSRPDEIIAYRRGGSVVLVNPYESPVSFTVTDVDIAGARDLLSGALQDGARVELGAYGVLLLELED